MSRQIFQYTDYRDFIKDRLAQFKKDGRAFSFENIARKIKTTKSYLKLIADKKRHTSIEKVMPLCDLFELNDFEKQFFIFLFLKNTAKNPEIKEFFASILCSYAASKKFIDPVTKNQAALEWSDEQKYIYRNWIYMAIPNLVRREDYQHDVKWIQNKLGSPKVLSIESIKNCLNSLIENGRLYQSNGTWQMNLPGNIDHLRPTDVEEFQRFKTGLSRTSLALDFKGKSNLHRPSRFQMYCIGITEIEQKELVQIYDELDRKLVELTAKCSNPERIMFVSNNIFSVAQD